jgi:cytochrome c peroxidase
MLQSQRRICIIEFYDDTEKFIKSPINKDTLLAKPLGLTEGEKKDLLEFLKSLTDKRFAIPPHPIRS